MLFFSVCEQTTDHGRQTTDVWCKPAACRLWSVVFIIDTLYISIRISPFMNQVKKIAGIVWMILGPIAVYYLAKTALHEIQKKPVIDTKIQWGVFVIIFIPIAIGLVIFGWYAFKGEYNRLPGSSKEIE